jgi:hypothetical protein
MQVFWLYAMASVLLPRQIVQWIYERTTRLQRRVRAGVSPASLLAADPPDQQNIKPSIKFSYRASYHHCFPLSTFCFVRSLAQALSHIMRHTMKIYKSTSAGGLLRKQRFVIFWHEFCQAALKRRTEWQGK